LILILQRDRKRSNTEKRSDRRERKAPPVKEADPEGLRIFLEKTNPEEIQLIFLKMCQNRSGTAK
jgi:hypothetical protein